MTTTNDTRRAFLDFFGKNGHTVLPSSPLVPHNDPTLMFTNAGMNQFKNIFTGQEKPKAPRAATSQKCVRAGGKHNDLDNVGYTARHHTFFEMLGNFSFGDYFKEQAIALAWELITKEFKIPAEKLCVTVYHTDDEAFGLWKKIAGLPEQKIIRIPTSDNFWSMGDTGPCGPCSEIFYDHGAHIPGGPPGSPEADGDRFIEIWNLVFMQYEQKDAGTRIDLPKPSIDTGMGLERITAVLQGVHDNYDIDLFRQLIADITSEASLVGAKSQTVNFHNPSTAYRVIADHLRSSCFLIADGVLPSNEGRGYVLRRIMRRAMRYAHQLGCNEPLMHRLVRSLVKEMGDAYPELARAQSTITETLKAEEERFKQTLERGLKLLEEESGNLAKGATLHGEIAFKLYDTYGFPLDLTEDILRARGIGVDNAGFEAAMERQKDMARAAWSGSGEKATETLWFSLREKLGPTRFTGYDTETGEGKILALVKDGQEVQALQAGEEGYAVLDATPFYGESGGQAGDEGVFRFSRNAGESAIVLDTQKPLGDFHVHKIKTVAPLKVGDTIVAEVDHALRTRTRANHSATHLLHYALRKHLGDHVAQKGSLVNAERLRFDFSHPKALTHDELQTIEQEVNAHIWANTETGCAEMTPDAAIAAGAVAMFGEKYGDSVRVLTLGPSKELCGGTHVARTGDAGVFRILSESSIASGVRRIEAVTMQGAYEYLAGQDARLKDLALALKTTPDALAERIETLVNERKKLEKELAEAKKKLAIGGASGGGAVEAETIGDVKFASKAYPDLPPGELRPLAEQLLKPLGENGVVAVASGFEGKGSIVVAVAKPLAAKLSAVTLVQTAIPTLGGKGGGGKPEMAQGGGPEGGKIEEALAAVRGVL